MTPHTHIAVTETFSTAQPKLLQRPELLGFALLLAVFSGPMLFGTVWQSMIFQPDAVRAGEWWRVLTHPFVHITWYHLSLDASAFFLLYNSLLEAKVMRRLAYVFAGGAGSLLLSWMAAPAISTNGLCGISGIAHGLMAVSAVEMMSNQPRHSPEWRIGALTFAIVVGKGAFEAMSGHILFGFLYFGMVGDPVAVSHAGGIVGSLAAMLIFKIIEHSRNGKYCGSSCRAATTPPAQSRRNDLATTRDSLPSLHR